MSQQARITWRDGRVPVSDQFDDPYFSLEDGLEETRHVFLAGNDLPARFRDGFEVAELGFGTGLNFLVTWAAWEAAGCAGRFTFTSFEAFPMARADRAQSLAAFPDLAPYAAALTATPDLSAADLGPARLRVVTGDARVTLAQEKLSADAWFLDGFSPAKNPELWDETLMAEVARKTASGGTFATYTAAGHVRRSLEAAGFAVERTPGFGRKRHMSRGIKR